MHLTKAQEYGLLLTLYVARSGRARLQDVAKGLNLSLPFLEQVARKLRIGEVLKSVRGPGGGYLLEANPTVMDVLDCLDFQLPEQQNWLPRSPESRALMQYTRTMKQALMPLLRRRVQSLNLELAANEVAALDRLTADTSIN